MAFDILVSNSFQSMIRIYLFLLLILTSKTNTYAQVSGDVASYKHKISSAKQDTARADLLLKFGRYYLTKPGEYKNDLDSALLLSSEARTLSTALHYDNGIGQSILLDGQVYREGGKKDMAWKTNERATQFFISHKLKFETGEAYRAAASFFSASDDENLHKKIDYTEKAIPLLETKGNNLELAYALQDLGDYYQINNDIQRSIQVLQKALEVYQALKYKQIQGVTNLLGYVYHLNGENILALKYGLMAVKVADEVGDNGMQLCTIYHRLAITYYVLKNYNLALGYYRKAAAIAEKYKDIGAIQEIKFNLALLLSKSNNSAQAIDELKQLVKRYPLADKEQVITADFLFLNLYIDLKQYKNAKAYVDSLNVLRAKYPKEASMEMSFNTPLIRYYFETRDYDKSFRYLRSNDSILRVNHMQSPKMNNELIWSRIDSAQGNFESALAHYKIYKTVSDSTKSQSLRKQLAELQLQFDVDRKDQHIAMLTQTSQLQENRIRIESIYRKLFIGGIIVLFVFLGLVFNRYLIKTRNNIILEKKQTEINYQNDLLKELVNEKEWLLKEIHHRVKNNLQIVISLLNTQSAFLENEDALSAIRNSQHRMHAMSLIHQRLYQTENIGTIDMVSYIHELVNYLKDSFSSDQQISYILDILPLKLDVAAAVPLGLILNEAICNSIKYAFVPGARGVIKVVLKEIDSDKYMLQIIDNGIGLPAEFDIATNNSLGMSLMQGLAQQLDGAFDLIYDKGLNISITFIHNELLKHDKTKLVTTS